MSEFISVNDAAKMTADFRAIRESMLQTSFQENGTLPICETFIKEQVLELLNQEGCEELRIYQGLNSNNQVVLILVGVDSEGADMLTNDVLEAGTRCPTICPTTSSLNS